VSVQLTQHSATYTNSSTATFTYTVSDQVGEDVSHFCELDGTGFSCAPGVQEEMTGVPAGAHTLTIGVENVSGSLATAEFAFTVDQTAPFVTTSPTGLQPLTGPVSVEFSEPVTGVSAGSVAVALTDTGKAVPGHVTYDANTRTARWVPSGTLVPGEHYSLSLAGSIVDRAGNPLSPGSFVFQPTTAIESSSAALVENWDPDKSRKAYGRAFAVSSAAGSTLTWSITTSAGRHVTVVGVRGPSGGRAAVRVDGVKRGTISFFASQSGYRVKLFTSKALSRGAHTVQVKVLGTKPAGSKGTDVAVDALLVGTVVKQETAARQVFRRVTAKPASGGSYDLVTHRLRGDTGASPSYSLVFRGTGVAVYATKLPSSGRAQIRVDGVLRSTVNLHARKATYGVKVFNLAGLADKRHTLRVVCLGTRTGAGSAVALDRIAVSAPPLF
jgi:hypothetical protein